MGSFNFYFRGFLEEAEAKIEPNKTSSLCAMCLEFPFNNKLYGLKRNLNKARICIKIETFLAHQAIT